MDPQTAAAEMYKYLQPWARLAWYCRCAIDVGGAGRSTAAEQNCRKDWSQKGAAAGVEDAAARGAVNDLLCILPSQDPVG